MEYFSSPFPEGLILSTHLITSFQLQEPLTPKFPQQVVHVLAERAEVGVSAAAQGEHSKPDIAEGTEVDLAYGAALYGVGSGEATSDQLHLAVHLYERLWGLHLNAEIYQETKFDYMGIIYTPNPKFYTF